LDSDSQLVKRIKGGDREALAALYGRYLPSLWRYVHAQLRGDDPTSRDVVSETFLAAIRNLTETNVSVTSVGSWLIGIARHKLADYRRLSSKQLGTTPPDLLGQENDPAQSFDASDTRCIIARVMDRLDDLERTVLEWKYIEELSVREIAQRLNRTDKAIEAMLYRARHSFKALYQEMLARDSDRTRRSDDGI
jgi:RNA polymerase sigma factor (sigma-70 family)